MLIAWTNRFPRKCFYPHETRVARVWKYLATKMDTNIEQWNWHNLVISCLIYIPSHKESLPMLYFFCIWWGFCCTLSHEILATSLFRDFAQLWKFCIFNHLIIKITISSIVIGLKKLLFSTNLLAKLLSDSLLLDSLLLDSLLSDSYQTVQ